MDNDSLGKFPQYYAIDITKFIMAVCVVAIHTHPFYSYETISSWFPYLQTFFSNAVPFFFITSSFLFFKKYFSALIVSEEKASNVFWKYIRHIGFLYLGWSLIYLPLAIIYYYVKRVVWWKAILVYIRDLFLLGKHFNSFPLWYLLSTLYSALIIYWLLRKGWKKISITVLSFIIYFIANYITDFVAGIETYTGIEFIIAKGVVLTIHDGRLMTGILFFSIGMVLAECKFLNRLQPVFLCPLWLTLFIASSFLNVSIIKILMFVLFFVIIVNIKIKPNTICYLLRCFSTHFYFLHMLVFSVWTYIVGWDNKYGAQGFGFSCFGCIILGLGIVALQRKYNWQWLRLLFN